MSKYHIKPLTLLVILSMLATLLSSCAPAAPVATTAPAKATAPATTPVKTVLNVQLPGNPSILIPNHAAGVIDMDVNYNIYDNLVEMNKGDFYDLIPSLAEKWEISPDGKTYTFFIRKGVKFHNGDELTSNDVAYTFTMVTKSATTSGKTYMFDHSEIVDKYTVKLYLKDAFPALLGLLASPAFGIVNAKLIEQYGDKEQAVVGTGAYKLAKWSPGEVVVLQAFEEYWRGAPPIKTINNRIISDNNTAFIAFQKGELDVYKYGGSFDLEAVSKNKNIVVTKVERTAIQTLWFNMQVKPLDDVRVRQAINYAIDREAVNKAVTDGLGTTTQLKLPKGHPGYTEDVVKYPYDPEKAKALLADAGFKKGDIKLTMMYPTTTVGTKFATAVQSFLIDVGIDLKTEGVEMSAFTQRNVKRDYQLTWNNYGTTPYNPANTFKAINRSDANFNLNNFKGLKEAAIIDPLIDEALSTADVAKQTKLLEESIKKERELAVDAPIFMENTYIMLNSQIQGANFEKAVCFTKYYLWKWQ